MYLFSQFNHIQNINITNKRILLRVDLNVPINQGTIVDDFRLQAIVPTLHYIHDHGGLIILATHIGRPTQPHDALSTKILVAWFQKHGFTIDYEPDLQKAYEKSLHPNNKILLLENLRFFPGEKSKDEKTATTFAQQLAKLGDMYINDAFGVAHRDDTSVTRTPRLFDAEHKAIGFLIEKELLHLNKLLQRPEKPFVLVLGGGKASDKIPLILAMLDRIDTLLLCPALVFTFLKALGKPTGLSLVDDAAIADATLILSYAKQRNIKIHFPFDYQIAHGDLKGPLEIVSASAFPADGIGTSIGPETMHAFSNELQNAGTIVYNCAMGFIARPETLHGSQALLNAIGQSSAYSIIGGGDSVAMARYFGLADAASFLSSGGGATLTYLANKPLPGLEAMLP